MITYKFCPYCGTKAKRAKNHITCPRCNKQVFSNSIPAVGVLMLKDSKVLLSKRGNQPKKGYFDYPGGFLEKGEHPADGAKRELLEESGVTIKIIGLLGVYINYDYNYQGVKLHPLDIIYVAKIAKGKINPQDDVDKFEWFPINNPPQKIAFIVVQEALRDLKGWHKKYRGVV